LVRFERVAWRGSDHCSASWVAGAADAPAVAMTSTARSPRPVGGPAGGDRGENGKRHGHVARADRRGRALGGPA